MSNVPPLHKSQAYICKGGPSHEKSLKRITIAIALILSLATLSSGILTHATSKTYDTTTLAGQLASVNDTAGLHFRVSDFLHQEPATSQHAPAHPPGTPRPPPPDLADPPRRNAAPHPSAAA